MQVKKCTELVIYESPDGGKTVYKRVSGQTTRQMQQVSPELESELDRIHREEQWMAILALAERTPALQDAVDRCIMLYELSKTEHDQPVLWHPV